MGSVTNFDFRRDADGKPLWHAPVCNPEWDAGVEGAPMWGPCQLCGEPWPCETGQANTGPIAVTGIWLRTGRDAQELEVLAEIEGQWRVVIRQNWSQGDLLSHIVESLGMRHAEVVS